MNAPEEPIEHVTLPVLDEGRTRVVHREVFEVHRTAAGHVRLLHSPAFVDGVAAGDVLTLDPAVLCGYRIVERAGMLAVVVVGATPAQRAQLQATLAGAIADLRGVFDGGPGNTLVFSVPVTGGFGRVGRVLADVCKKFEGAQWWYGNVYDEKHQPLGWWREAPWSQADPISGR